MEAKKPQIDRQESEADAQVLAAVRQGDRAAFATLVRRWEDSLLRIAQRIVGCDNDADEIRQIVLLRILEAPQRLPEAIRFAAWIRRCVVNEAVTRARRRDVQRRSRKGVAAVSRMQHAFPAWQNAASAEEASRLHAALQELDSDARTLLSLRFDEDLTFREIADVLEQPVSTVKSQLARAIARLKSLIGRSVEQGEA